MTAKNMTAKSTTAFVDALVNPTQNDLPSPGQRLESLFVDVLTHLGRGKVELAAQSMKAVELFCFEQPPLTREEHARLLSLQKRVEVEASLQRATIQQDLGQVGKAKKAGSAYNAKRMRLSY
ncbi:MAG: hypothetical protein GY822_28135 [Deltaproteobacteria bacterium]|nr:hypothetical protein [Deltaproteobacteria bacterium]